MRKRRRDGRSPRETLPGSQQRMQHCPDEGVADAREGKQVVCTIEKHEATDVSFEEWSANAAPHKQVRFVQRRGVETHEVSACGITRQDKGRRVRSVVCGVSMDPPQSPGDILQRGGPAVGGSESIIDVEYAESLLRQPAACGSVDGFVACDPSASVHEYQRRQRRISRRNDDVQALMPMSAVGHV